MDEAWCELFIVGPTDPATLVRAVEYLSLPTNVELDTWSVDGQRLVFCTEPTLAGGLARAIASIDGGHGPLMEGRITTGPEDAEAAITRHLMDRDGTTFAAHTVTLTYAEHLDDPQGVLELEMIHLFEFEAELQRVD